MNHHPFDPVETLRSQLRRPETKASLVQSGVVDLDFDSIANGEGSMSLSQMVKVFSACGIEIVRSDYLNAVVVMAQVGASQIKV